jgi:hypothetical protein
MCAATAHPLYHSTEGDDRKMRHRLSVVLVGLAIVVTGVVVGPAPAMAAPGLTCVTNLPGTAEIRCTFNPDGPAPSPINWTVDFVLREDLKNKLDATISPCIVGKTYKVSVSYPSSAGLEIKTLPVVCEGISRPIADVFVGCSSGGNRMQCSVTWTGGTYGVNIRWTVNGVLRTFFNDQWWLDLSCNGVYDMYISVTVSDPYSAQTASGYCSCHGGPLD